MTLPSLRCFILTALIVFSVSVTSAQNPSFNWSVTMGSVGVDVPKAIAVDDSGYIYTAGMFRGTVDFDPGPGINMLTSQSASDIFITKMTPQHNLVWAKSIGGINDDYPAALTVTGDHLYFSGMIVGWVDFDPGPGVMNLWGGFSATMFFTRWDLNGNMELAKTFDGSPSELAGMAVDNKGNMYFTGSISYTVDFDPGPATYNLTSSGGSDAFLCKVDSLGHLRWVRQFKSSSDDYGKSVGVDSLGNVYTSGTFHGTGLQFSTIPNPTYVFGNGGSELFICRHDSSGNLVWAKSLGGSQNDNAYSMRVDAGGNSYILADYGPGSTFQQYFVLKYDAAGKLYYQCWFQDLWANIEGEGLAIDKYGAAYVTGYRIFSQPRHFLAKVDPFGFPLWSTSWGGPGYGMSMSVAVDSQMNIYTTGFFMDTADFDPGAGVHNAVAAGDADGYVTKFTQCVVTSLAADTVCADSILPNGPVYPQSWTYYIGYNGSQGCDSFVIWSLTVPVIDTAVTLQTDTLTVNQSSAQYQWLSCPNMQPIPGATNKSYTPTVSGSYAVIVTVNSCSDTSGCIPVAITVEIDEVNNSSQLNIVPNPAYDRVEISAGVFMNRMQVRIRSASGKLVYEHPEFTGTMLTIDVSNYAAGLYFVELSNGATRCTGKLIKH